MVLADAIIANNGDVVVMIGKDQVHHVGRTCYRFRSDDVHGNRTFKGTPVMFVEDHFNPTQLGSVINRDWDTQVTVC